MEDSRRQEKVSYNHLVNSSVSSLRKCNTIWEQIGTSIRAHLKLEVINLK